MAIQIQGFSLKTLNQKLRQAREAEVESATIIVKFSSPKGFEHDYTLTDIEDLDELSDEINQTEDIAKERLLENWLTRGDRETSERQWQEVKETLVIDEPEEVKDFRTLKQVEDDLEDARNATRSIYDRTSFSRTQRIQSALEDSENLDVYMERLGQVDETLDFEENVGLDTDESAFQEGRQRTTGDVTWVNEEGQEVRTLIFPSSVTFQIGGPQGEQVQFDNKQEALEYFRQNRVA